MEEENQEIQLPDEVKAIVNRMLGELAVILSDTGYLKGEIQDPRKQSAEPSEKIRTASMVLDELGLVLEDIESLKQKAQLLVDQAREQRATWIAIGKVAGISGEVAYRRWTERGRAQHRDQERRRRQRNS